MSFKDINIKGRTQSTQKNALKSHKALFSDDNEYFAQETCEFTN